MTTDDDIRALGARWAHAEQAGDTNTLAELAAADFRLVGPFGFVLDKTEWIDRYATGDLATHSLVWDEVEVRDFGQSLAVPAGSVLGLLGPNGSGKTTSWKSSPR